MTYKELRKWLHSGDREPVGGITLIEAFAKEVRKRAKKESVSENIHPIMKQLIAEINRSPASDEKVEDYW